MPLEFDFEQGVVLAIDKPLGWSSADVVRKVQAILRKQGYRVGVGKGEGRIKIGHAGTLDPLATGLLLVCLGKATKRVEALQSETKEYLATIELGATTPSYDLEHPVDARYPWEHITPEGVREALAGFVGQQQQLPPLYSAKRLDGRRAYEYARKGREAELQPVPVTFYAAELLRCELPVVEVRIECSNGTYIRSVARDLGQRLGSGGHLTALRRTRNGGFDVADAWSIEEFEKKVASE